MEFADNNPFSEILQISELVTPHEYGGVPCPLIENCRDSSTTIIALFGFTVIVGGNCL